ncbi:MAG TPA: hypothetical protein P5189_05635, partial [Methanomassiliicoccales archaeon]|nr:hypothetical protein [Methanomassiliicoccales archaeon]
MQKVMRRDPVTLPLKMSMTEAQRAMTAKQHYLRPMVGAVEWTPAVAVRERLDIARAAEPETTAGHWIGAVGARVHLHYDACFAGGWCANTKIIS